MALSKPDLNVFHWSKRTASALVALFYAVHPICICLLVLHYLQWFRLPLGLQVYCAAEALFGVYHFYLAKRAQRQQAPLKRDQEQILRLFQQAMRAGVPAEEALSGHAPLQDSDSATAKAFRRMFGAWFHNTPLEEIGRDDALNWLAWSICDKESAMLSDDERSLCLDCLAAVEARAGITFPKGSRGARSMRLAFDAVQVAARPLILYAVVNGWNLYWDAYLRYRGFKMIKSTDGTLECLLWVPPGWKATQNAARPIVFLHGLGTGVFQYVQLILDLMRPRPNAPPRPILIPLHPSLSMSFWHPQYMQPHNQATFMAAFLNVVDQLEWRVGQVDVLAHSMGCIFFSWILKSCPEMCFVDPVCFCLYEPHVVHNFLYRQPTTGIQVLMRYFVAQELGIALTLQRHFDWTSNLLWLEDIPEGTNPKRCRFYLAGEDGILSAADVRQYLLGRGVRDGEGLFINWGAKHAEVLIAGKDGFDLDHILTWLLAAS